MTLTEALPAHSSLKAGAMAFIPADPATNAYSPLAGTLGIRMGRASAAYRVEEFPADEGRGFLLVKLVGGTDQENRQYSVFCAAGAPPKCECKGFERWGVCKHADAIGICLGKGWL